MSRVAEALLKSGRESREEDAPPAAAPIEPPWELTDPAAAARHVLTHPAIGGDPAGLVLTPTRPPDAPAPAADRAGHTADRARHGTVDELTPLVQRVFQPGAEAPSVRAVLFAPIGLGAESGALCARAADALAGQTSLAICAVDADLRTAALHVTLGLPNGRGLSDAIAAGDLSLPIETFTVRVRGNLWALRAGSRGAEALPYLAPDVFRAVVTDLLGRFDYVLIAGPSRGGGEAAVLGAAVHGVVLVLQANATRREAARRVADDLRAARVPILGAVLGNRTFPIPDAIYRKL